MAKKKPAKNPKMPKPAKHKPVVKDEAPPEDHCAPEAPPLFPDNVAPQKDNPAPPPDETKADPPRVELSLPVHPDCSDYPDCPDVSVVPKPVEPAQALAVPVTVRGCHVAIWTLPWGRYVLLAAPPGDDSLDALKDGQEVDVDFMPPVSIDAKDQP